MYTPASVCCKVARTSPSPLLSAGTGITITPIFTGSTKKSTSRAPGQGHKEMLRWVAAHRHGEDFNADIDNEYSYKMGVWCAKTACAYWRQALKVEFVNNREETIAKRVAKVISRHGDGVHNDRVKCAL